MISDSAGVDKSPESDSTESPGSDSTESPRSDSTGKMCLKQTLWQFWHTYTDPPFKALISRQYVILSNENMIRYSYNKSHNQLFVYFQDEVLTDVQADSAGKYEEQHQGFIVMLY